MHGMLRIVPALFCTLMSACAVGAGSHSDRTAHEPDKSQIESVARGGCFQLRLEPNERGGLRIPPQIVCPVTGGLSRDER